jgi:D-threonine aldolase
MDAQYELKDVTKIITPGLLVFQDVLEQNLDRMVQIAGDPSRLRPHCKTHKTCEIVELQLKRGITKHKCATFAEAEMLATAGVKDIFLAYSLVGPNIARAVDFCKRYPDVTLAVTADHERPIVELGQAMQNAGQMIDVLLDLDTGQHRTGVPIGPHAADLYRLINDTAKLNPGGLHLYDGQNHQTDVDERRLAVGECWNQTASFRDELEAAGMQVPRIVAGGTGSFPIFAEFDDAAIELSPGTCVYHDAGYGGMFPDLDFKPAALLLTRVISRPTENRVTVDLGYKAVASDPAMENRAVFPSLPDAKLVLQNEEHLVLETSKAAEFSPGDYLLAIPRHVCPTSAMHKEVTVIQNGEPVGVWPIASRDRKLTI